MSKIDKQLKKLFKKLDTESAKPSAEWLASSRQQIQSYINDNPMPASSQVEHFSPEPARRSWFMRPAGVLASILIAVLAIGSGTTYAAQGAEPGDALYPLKLVSENFNIFVNVSPEAKAKLYIKYADRRMEELEKLYEKEPENEYWQEKVVQNMGQQIISAKDVMEELETETALADVALEFDSLTEKQDQKLQDIQVKLNTTTEIINRIQELNEINKQKAMEAMEEARKKLESKESSMLEKNNQLRRKLEARLELLKARQQSLRDKFNEDKEDMEARTESKDDIDELDIEDYEDDDYKTNKYEMEFDDEGVYFESEVEVESEGDENVETNVNVNDGQVIINSSIQATGTSIFINESNTTIATSSTRVEVKGAQDRWRDDFFENMFRNFESKFKFKQDKDNDDKGNKEERDNSRGDSDDKDD